MILSFFNLIFFVFFAFFFRLWITRCDQRVGSVESTFSRLLFQKYNVMEYLPAVVIKIAHVENIVQISVDHPPMSYSHSLTAPWELERFCSLLKELAHEKE